MMPGADSQPQGTYFFGPGSSQALPVGGMGGGESSIVADRRLALAIETRRLSLRLGRNRLVSAQKRGE
jgi:hypothetical protein